MEKIATNNEVKKIKMRHSRDEALKKLSKQTNQVEVFSG